MLRRRTFAAVSVAFVLAGCAAREEKMPATTSSVRPVLDAYVAAWNNHDSAALDTLLAADGVHEDLAQGFVGHGSAQVKGFMRDVSGMEPDYHWVLTNVIESGSHIAAEWTWTSTYTGPGPYGPVKNLRMTGRGMSSAEVENGKIKKFTDYYDNASFFPKPADSTKKG